jgi:hypothetical protein
MNEITINGVVYVPKEDLEHIQDYESHVYLMKNSNIYAQAALIAHYNILE